MSSGDCPLNILPLPSGDIAELKCFCAPDADRFSILQSSLKRRRIPFEIIPIGNAKHIALPVPNASSLDGEYYRVTLVAHYDRVTGTPGANDNAAAVFQILSHWEDIRRLGWNHRTQVIFTDKEELTGDMKATDQGAWHLARHLSRLQAKNILFFVCDMCGIGNTPIWGRSVRKAGLMTGKGPDSRSYEAMEGFLRRFTGGRDFGVNPMFSDDLGLLLGGYPALQLSLLPRKEADMLASQFRKAPAEADPEAPAREREQIRSSLPHSWRANHTPKDSVETLDPGSFLLMGRLLRDLARFRFPLS